MAITEWWRDDPGSRYWMEITDRKDLGADLHAPQLNDLGREYWGYSLVTAVRPGDIVLHWHKSLLAKPGVVAFSTADHGPVADTIIWSSQGTSGRTHAAAAIPEPSWKFYLTGYTPLSPPADQEAFRRVEPRLREIKEELTERYQSSLYFPFAFSDTRAVRAAQGYLVKMPAEILDAVPELRQIPRPGHGSGSPARPPAAELTKRAERARSGGGGGRAGRQSDLEVRLAIERHAVDWAIAYFEGQGYSVQDKGATESFDLLASRPGHTLHVEVKGSAGEADAVELTSNEVSHALGVETHLVVVDRIHWDRRPDGTVDTSRGRARWWGPWTPDQARLEITRYRYRLPPHTNQVDLT